MVEKVPEFSAESTLPSSGDGNQHQRPLVTIPWRRQRDSAENSGTFSPIILTLYTECLIRNDSLIYLGYQKLPLKYI